MSSSVMLVNVLEEAEARVAVVEDGNLQEFYLERANAENIVGNIYKGRIVNVKSSIEASFVDFGYERHGFLHASDIKPSVARKAVARDDDRRGVKNIRKAVKGGDTLLVQVIKEGIGDKGPALTTYLSLPGRYLVLMPEMSLKGVSRRIESQEERQRVRSVVKGLKVPEGAGVIARTAAEGRNDQDLKHDLQYLSRLWEAICKREKESSAPAMIYQESDQIIRVIRDVFDDDVRRIYVDSEEVFAKARAFMHDVMPRHVRKIKLYKDETPIFHKFEIEKQIAEMHGRTVNLECGGSIIIEQTEALVAIDVNSGQFRGKGNAEDAALRINIEAAGEIARQIRLRDLGGLIIIDFIDMDDRGRRKKLEKALQEGLARDKARFRMLPMSDFGIVELTRQRRRKSLSQSTFAMCPNCLGTGLLKTPETISLELVRRIKLGIQQKNVGAVRVTAPPDVANYLNNTMRTRILEMERSSGKSISIQAVPGLLPTESEVHCVQN